MEILEFWEESLESSQNWVGVKISSEKDVKGRGEIRSGEGRLGEGG